MLLIPTSYTAFSAVAPTSLNGSSAPLSRQSLSQAVPQNPKDRTTISPDGLKASRQGGEEIQEDKASTRQTGQDEKAALTAEELKQLAQLKSRDREVRAHEQAHLSVAGQYASGGASFSLQRGPDGNSYAIGGEVPIDSSSESTPESTIQKMRTIRRAALAPADPSGPDRQIAAQASAKELQARQEIAAELQEDLSSLVSADISGKKQEGRPNPPTAVQPSSPDTTRYDNSRKMMIAAYQRFNLPGSPSF